MMDIGRRLLSDYNKALAEGAKWASDYKSEYIAAKTIALELYESRKEIIDYVHGLEAKLADYENHLDELEQEKGA